MFYSEALLSKTGPLARVWLSANLERKLSKTHILQSSVKDSVDAIVNPDQAPMALRLSGQLLLGVVRIYSRKARYLLDDCNEALMKIKMVRIIFYLSHFNWYTNATGRLSESQTTTTSPPTSTCPPATPSSSPTF